LCVTAPAPAAAAPRSPAQLTRAALIGQAQLGSGWSQSSPAPKTASQLDCHPGTKKVSGELARAASPTFSQSQQGPFAFELVALFGSPAAARSWWRGAVHPSLGRCFSRQLAAGSSGGVTLKATSSEMLPLTGAPAGLARYRVSGQAVSSGQSTPVDLDVLLLKRGGYVAELQLSSFGDPPADALERRLARAVARRLPAR
jgi:hypothetical protein